MSWLAMIRNMFARFTARRRYFAAADEAAQAWAELTEPHGTPLTRCHALSVSAGCERTMSANTFGFHRADERDGDGFTLAESHGMTALLCELVADTEFAALRPDVDTAWWRRRSTLTDDPAVASVLAALSTESRAHERAGLTLALYTAVVDRVGGQAAEVLASIASGYYALSGMSLTQAQWLTGPDGPDGRGGER